MKLEDHLTRQADAQREFIPDAILPYNIASNKGLLLALTRVLVLANQYSRIQVLMVDVNIYKRILKVLQPSDTHSPILYFFVL